MLRLTTSEASATWQCRTSSAHFMISRRPSGQRPSQRKTESRIKKNYQSTTVSSNGYLTDSVEGGKCNQYLGQYEEAIAHYDIAMKQIEGEDSAQEATILYHRGLAYASLMKWHEAAQDY